MENDNKLNTCCLRLYYLYQQQLLMPLTHEPTEADNYRAIIGDYFCPICGTPLHSEFKDRRSTTIVVTKRTLPNRKDD